MRLIVLTAWFVLAASAATPLEQARDKQDIPALGKLLDASATFAEKSPNDPKAQYQAALAASYLAEVHVELHERKPARDAAERGIPFAEKAVALKPDAAEYFRILGTLYGQAVADLMSGLRYGARAKDAIAKAVQLAPKSAAMYVARGVGNLYLPAQLGGGPEVAIPDFRKAISIDPKFAEAWIYLGVAFRTDKNEDEARKAFNKALELDPDRFWVKQLLAKLPGK
ncbi:MAG TPA: tetratricopeptide repeat protein [Verrucomicrobiae bacterium]|nr:tetratricopeptide repeat protein [Verrucomicrobiae bacterium]